jgi:hypothetical protein
MNSAMSPYERSEAMKTYWEGLPEEEKSLQVKRLNNARTQCHRSQTMKKFIIQAKQNAAFIDEYTNIEEAKIELARFEWCDIQEGSYSPEFYEIIEVDLN